MPNLLLVLPGFGAGLRREVEDMPLRHELVGRAGPRLPFLARRGLARAGR